MPPEKPNKVKIVAAGAEGDTVTLELNVHQHLRELLHAALKALYGNPARDPNLYDVVIGGNVADLDETIEAAGLTNGSEVAVLPKDVSRGSWT